MKIRLNPHRHCAGFLFTSSASKTQNIDQRVAASEGSLAVGGSGKFLESGSLDLSGANNANLGGEFAAGGDITITSSDPEVLTTALEQIGELSRSNTSAFSSYAKQIQEEKSEDLATLLGAVGDLKEDTDSAAQNRKTFLYLVLGILGLLAVLFFPKRK